MSRYVFLNPIQIKNRMRSTALSIHMWVSHSILICSLFEGSALTRHWLVLANQSSPLINVLHSVSTWLHSELGLDYIKYPGGLPRHLIIIFP